MIYFICPTVGPTVTPRSPQQSPANCHLNRRSRSKNLQVTREIGPKRWSRSRTWTGTDADQGLSAVQQPSSSIVAEAADACRLVHVGTEAEAELSEHLPLLGLRQFAETTL